MYLSHLFMITDHSTTTQIETTDGPANPILFLWFRPTKINLSGCVFIIDDSANSFVLIMWQEITGIPPLTPLTIRAIMCLSSANIAPTNVFQKKAQ